MYGWRGLIGLINPTYRGRLIAEWYAMLPRGVGLIPCTLGISRGEQDIFSKSFELAEKIARDLALWGADVIVQPGLPPWLVKGPAFEKEWVARLEAETKVPMVTPAGATVRAMQALGLKRVVMATYFGDELNSKLADGLRRAGIEIAHMEGYRLSEATEGLYTTPLVALNRVGPDEVYRFVRSLCQKARDIDGVYIVGGGWDAGPAVEVLERDLRKPVVFAVTAALWACLRRIGVNEPITGHGRLLEV